MAKQAGAGDHRRGSRIISDFWIAVEGVDREPQRRRGNLSASGIYFEADRPVGRVGSVQWISVAAPDRALSVDLMGRVVRAVILDDARSGAVTGVALELMPENVDKRLGLEALVSYVERCQIDAEIDVHVVAEQPDPAVDVGDPPPLPEPVSVIDLQRLAIYARWRPQVGEIVALELDPGEDTAGRRTRGKVVAVTPDGGKRHRIELSLDAAGQVSDEPVPAARSGHRVGSGSVVDAIDALFADLLVVGGDLEPPPLREHLAGELSRIRLPSLLALFEMERMSGRIELVRGEHRARVFVRAGQVVDAEDDRGRPPREILADLIGWGEGRFEYRMGEVAREDRIGTSTTGLLLDLARQQDEATQASST